MIWFRWLAVIVLALAAGRAGAQQHLDVMSGAFGGGPYPGPPALTVTVVAQPAGAVHAGIPNGQPGVLISYTTAPAGVYRFSLTGENASLFSATATEWTDGVAVNVANVESRTLPGTFEFTYTPSGSTTYPPLPPSGIEPPPTPVGRLTPYPGYVPPDYVTPIDKECCSACSAAAAGQGSAAGSANSGGSTGESGVKRGTGTANPCEDDVHTSGTGGDGMRRSYAGGGSLQANRGGKGWNIDQLASIYQAPSGKLFLAASATRTFAFSPNGSGGWIAAHAGTERLVVAPGELRFIDGFGNVTTFHDLGVTPAALRGQFKRFADTSGNCPICSNDLTPNPIK